MWKRSKVTQFFRRPTKTQCRSVPTLECYCKTHNRDHIRQQDEDVSPFIYTHLINEALDNHNVNVTVASIQKPTELLDLDNQRFSVCQPLHAQLPMSRRLVPQTSRISIRPEWRHTPVFHNEHSNTPPAKTLAAPDIAVYHAASTDKIITGQQQTLPRNHPGDNEGSPLVSRRLRH